MATWFGLILGVIAVLAPAAATAACDAPARTKFDQKVSIEGILRPGKGSHGAQGPFEYIYLALAQPHCVEPSGGEYEPQDGTKTPIERIQVAGKAAASGTLPMGKEVVVTGTLFGAHTAWHAEEVLIDAESIDIK